MHINPFRYNFLCVTCWTCQLFFFCLSLVCNTTNVRIRWVHLHKFKISSSALTYRERRKNEYYRNYALYLSRFICVILHLQRYETVTTAHTSTYPYILMYIYPFVGTGNRVAKRFDDNMYDECIVEVLSSGVSSNRTLCSCITSR